MTILYYLHEPESGGETAFPVAGLHPESVLEEHEAGDDNLVVFLFTSIPICYPNFLRLEKLITGDL